MDTVLAPEARTVLVVLANSPEKARAIDVGVVVGIKADEHILCTRGISTLVGPRGEELLQFRTRMPNIHGVVRPNRPLKNCQ